MVWTKRQTETLSKFWGWYTNSLKSRKKKKKKFVNDICIPCKRKVDNHIIWLFNILYIHWKEWSKILNYPFFPLFFEKQTHTCVVCSITCSLKVTMTFERSCGVSLCWNPFPSPLCVCVCFSQKKKNLNLNLILNIINIDGK